MPLPLINLLLLFMFIYLLWRRRYLQQYGVLPVLLIVAVNLVAELLAFYINIRGYKNGSFWIYNFSLPVELICYGLVYKKLFQRSNYLYFINAFIILVPVLSIFLFIAQKGIFKFNTAVAICGSVFLLVTTLYFFIRLFQADYFNQNPVKQFFFWLSTGVLLCYLGSLTYLSNVNLFTDTTPLQRLLQSLNFILNCFLYMCIFISVSCLRRYPDSQIQSF